MTYLRSFVTWAMAAGIAIYGCNPSKGDDGGAAGHSAVHAGGDAGDGTGGTPGADAGGGNHAGGDSGNSGDSAGAAGDANESGAAGISSNGGAGTSGGSGGASGAAGGNPYVTPAGPMLLTVNTASDPVAPSGRLLYTVTLSNISTHTLNTLALKVRVPVGLQFVYTADATPDAAYCTGGVCQPNAETSWAFPSLAAGASETVTVNALVLQTVGDGDSITSSFVLSAMAQNDVTVTKTVQVYSKAAAQLALGSAVDPVVPSQSFTLDLDVGQVGANALAASTLLAHIPPGLKIGSISDGGTQDSAQQVSWSIGAVPVGAILHRSVQVTVDDTVPAGALLSARAELTFTGGLAIDNAAEYTLVVADAPSPINVAFGATPSPATAGGRVLYTATVSNTSTLAIDGVNVALRMPVGLAFVYTTDSDPDSAYCTGGYCQAGNETGWTVGTLAAGTSRSIAFNAAVIATDVGSGSLMPSVFTVAATGQRTQRIAKTIPVYGAPAAQLALGSAVNPVTPGQAFTLNLDLGQVGPTALTGAKLRVFVPPGLTVGAISDGGAQASPGQVTWDIGAIPLSGTLHRTIAVTASPTAVAGTILASRAELSYNGGADTDVATELAVSVVPIAPPLTVTVSAAPSPAVLGSRLLYTTTITNTSVNELTNVALSIRVPPGLQFVYTTDSDPDSSYCVGGVCQGGAEVVWTFPILAAGAFKTVTVNPLVISTLTAGSLLSWSSEVTATGMTSEMHVQSVTTAQH